LFPSFQPGTIPAVCERAAKVRKDFRSFSFGKDFLTRISRINTNEEVRKFATGCTNFHNYFFYSKSINKEGLYFRYYKST